MVTFLPTPTNEMSFSAECALDFWPNEIIVHLMTFISAHAILAFGSTCRKANLVVKSHRLWQLLIERDWPSEYSEYLAKINKTNAISNLAEGITNTLNMKFAQIATIRQSLLTSVDDIQEGLRMYDQNLVEEKYFELEKSLSVIDDLQKNLEKTYQGMILSEPLVNLFEVDPMRLYREFLIDSKYSKTCLYVYTEGAFMGKTCNRSTPKRSDYCANCAKMKVQ